MLKVIHQSGKTETSAFYRFFILEKKRFRTVSISRTLSLTTCPRLTAARNQDATILANLTLKLKDYGTEIKFNHKEYLTSAHRLWMAIQFREQNKWEKDQSRARIYRTARTLVGKRENSDRCCRHFPTVNTPGASASESTAVGNQQQSGTRLGLCFGSSLQQWPKHFAERWCWRIPGTGDSQPVRPVMGDNS